MRARRIDSTDSGETYRTLAPLKALRPTDRSVIDAQYLNDISLQSIRENKQRLGDYELARARDAAGSPHLRMVGK